MTKANTTDPSQHSKAIPTIPDTDRDLPEDIPPSPSSRHRRTLRRAARQHQSGQWRANIQQGSWFRPRSCRPLKARLLSPHLAWALALALANPPWPCGVSWRPQTWRPRHELPPKWKAAMAWRRRCQRGGSIIQVQRVFLSRSGVDAVAIPIKGFLVSLLWKKRMKVLAVRCKMGTVECHSCMDTVWISLQLSIINSTIGAIDTFNSCIAVVRSSLGLNVRQIW